MSDKDRYVVKQVGTEKPMSGISASSDAEAKYIFHRAFHDPWKEYILYRKNEDSSLECIETNDFMK